MSDNYIDEQYIENPYQGDFYGSPNSKAPNALENYKRRPSYSGGERLGPYADPAMYTEDGHLKAGSYVGKPIDWSPSNVAKRILTLGALGNEDGEASKYNKNLDQQSAATETIVNRERALHNNEIRMAIDFLVASGTPEDQARQIANNHYAAKWKAGIAGDEKMGALSLNDKIQAEAVRMGLAEKAQAAQEAERQASLAASASSANEVRRQQSRARFGTPEKLGANEDATLTNAGDELKLGANDLQTRKTLNAIANANAIATATADNEYFNAKDNAFQKDMLDTVNKNKTFSDAQIALAASERELKNPSPKPVAIPAFGEIGDLLSGKKLFQSGVRTRAMQVPDGMGGFKVVTVKDDGTTGDPRSEYVTPNSPVMGMPGATSLGPNRRPIKFAAPVIANP